MLKRFFKKQAPLLARQVSLAYGLTLKADQDVIDRIMADLDLEGWSTLAGEESDLVNILQTVAQDGGVQAYAQLGIDDQNITDIVSTYAQDYAANRGAELVGKKIIGGQIVDNPNAKWSITQSTRDMLSTDVQQAVDEGWSTQRLADVIESNYAFSDTRAEMVARTEIAFADVGGNMQAYRDSGVVEGKEWILGPNPCDVCQENADEGVIGLDDTFSSGDDAVPAHPNCFLPGTLVAAKSITKYFKRRFQGKIVILGIAGKYIRVTPNHPILTNTGWVPAGKLQRGDLVAQLERWDDFIEYPDDDHIVSMIEQIPYALGVPRGVPPMRVPTTTEAFHGDGIANTEIEIIATDGFFTDEGNAKTHERLRKRFFARLHCWWIRLSRFGDFAAFVKANFSPAHSTMRSSDTALAFSGTRAGGFDNMSFAMGTNGQSHAIPSIAKRRTMATETFGDINRRFAEKVSLVQVDHVAFREYDGHVYNLETRDGWYFANSIISHNCECDIVPVPIDLGSGD